MRSLLPLCLPGLAAAQAAPRAAYALCLYTSHRCIFVRELSTPATLERSKSGVAPFHARLLWQFSSRRPRHLVLCVREPLPTVYPLAAEDAFEDFRGAEAAEASAAQTVVASVAPRAPEDFMYGRLFLRPYNVAQMLTVLQGWSDLPAVVNRPRSNLTLTAVPPPASKPEKSSNVDVRPREVMLTVCLTRKTVPRALCKGGGAAAAEAVFQSSKNADPIPDEDYPDSVYVDGDMCTLSAALRDSDLVLLTTHLESVLSDLFAIEHCSGKVERRKAFNPQDSGANHRTRGVSSPLERSSVRQPKYLSQRCVAAGRTRSKTMEHPHQSCPPRHSDDGGRRRRRVATAAASSASSAVTGAAEGGAAEWEPHPFAEASAKAAPAMAATQAEDDNYEEIVEDVVEVEGGEDVNKAATATSDAATSSTPTAPPPGSVASSTSYITTHTRERGEITMESADRYAEARFVRDGSVAASEVQAVDRAGDFDVLRRTRQVQGSTENGGSRATVCATEATGAFRSSSGGVTGNFSYERFTTTTEAMSEKVAAATAIPLHRETADADGDGAFTMEVTTNKSQPSTEGAGVKASEGEPCGQQKEAVVNEAAKPARRRQASGSAGAASKKTAKKKSRKTPTRRKSAASPSASVSASQGATECADAMTF
ncbi:hypothetical protein GH5_04582 [Leishmania sp. Ghana 2012 LV757]|uniref:hypothetical protein n=1 Tax=Leishmania sp. Ghana 2012 LV757 TaxID=2803181 RepID=UPI001B70FA9D|nr:hypothetical protein GH5_04582 [Leishmania sp. Ghana 2012 LV757]